MRNRGYPEKKGTPLFKEIQVSWLGRIKLEKGFL